MLEQSQELEEAEDVEEEEEEEAQPDSAVKFPKTVS